MSAPGIGIGIREFARRDGCSEKLVREAVKKGRLTALSNGTLDPAMVGTGWRQSARKGAEGTADSGAETPQTVRAIPAEVSPAVAAIVAAALGIGQDSFVQDVLHNRFVALHEAERVKENALALKHLLDGRQRAATLIERETAEAVLFETTRAARDAWMNWPVRVGPLLAADLGLDAQKVTEALIPYVHQQLEALGEPDADFTTQSG